MNQFYSGMWKALCLSGLFLLPTQGSAQSTGHDSWRFGLQAGLNYNMVGAGYQNLPGPVSGSFLSFTGVDGTGIGPSFGLMGEYNTRNWWGLQFRALYDSYNAEVIDESKPTKDKFDVSMAYLTLNPALRVNFTPQFYALVGPTLSLNMTGEYDYSPTEDGDATLTGVEIPDLTSMALGITAGFGYDIRTGAAISKLPLYITPYLEGGWVVQQRGNSFPDDQEPIDDTWSTVSVRLGAQFKLGIPDSAQTDKEQDVAKNIDLAVPENGLRVLNVVEFFPMLNQVFFEAGISEIPQRYKLLSQSEAQAFDENAILPPVDVATASRTQAGRQQDVYYNILNVYGARMRNNPAYTLRLIGASKDGDGAAMAESVKNYIVNTFGIDASRITTEEREKPRVPSGTASTPAEFRPLIDAENRRVEIVPGSTDMQKPVEVHVIEDSPIDNDILLVANENVNVRSWQVTISGNDRNLTFGPYSDPDQRIPSSPLLGEVNSASFEAEVVVTAEDGEIITKTKEFRLVRKPIDNSKIMYRYQILFDYAQADAVRTYESFLRQDLAPRIDKNANIYVIGYTDNIGSDAGNLKLSKDRSKEARTILSDQLRKLGNRSPVSAVGYGEDDSQALFRNTLPEGRFFNRSVIIETIPAE